MSDDGTYSTEIHDAYEALDAALTAAEVSDRALAHVCERDLATEPTPAGRRGFLSYLRWCIANPDQILLPPEAHCACGGSGWIDLGNGATRCTEHAPPVQERRSPVLDDGNREVAARAREMEDRRVR